MLKSVGNGITKVHEFTYKVDMSAVDIRAFCIEYDLYTCGDAYEYRNMLSRAGVLSPDTLMEIAEDIFYHSALENRIMFGDVKTLANHLLHSKGRVRVVISE